MHQSRRCPRALTGSILKPGRCFQPGLREIEIAQAHFIGLRLARPAKAFFGHSSIFLGRYHHALLLIDAGAHHRVRRLDKQIGALLRFDSIAHERRMRGLRLTLKAVGDTFATIHLFASLSTVRLCQGSRSRKHFCALLSRYLQISCLGNAPPKKSPANSATPRAFAGVLRRIHRNLAP